MSSVRNICLVLSTLLAVGCTTTVPILNEKTSLETILGRWKLSYAQEPNRLDALPLLTLVYENNQYIISDNFNTGDIYTLNYHTTFNTEDGKYTTLTKQGKNPISYKYIYILDKDSISGCMFEITLAPPDNVTSTCHPFSGQK